MPTTHARATRHSYGHHVRHAIETGDNPSQDKMSIRELARRVKLSYEQVRKICLGEPVVSKKSNTAICKELGLDANKMWQLAMEEKFSRRYGVKELPDQVPMTIGGKMGELWPKLSTEVREKVYAFAVLLHEEDLILQHRQKRIQSK